MDSLDVSAWAGTLTLVGALLYAGIRGEANIDTVLFSTFASITAGSIAYVVTEIYNGIRNVSRRNMSIQRPTLSESSLEKYLNDPPDYFHRQKELNVNYFR